MTEPIADPEAELPKMSFLDHLEELRKRLLISLIAAAVGFFACWAFAEPIFAKLQEPLTAFLPKGDKLAYTRLTAPFFLYMKVAFFAGLFLAAPVILLQVWLFVAPGLYKKERRLAAPFIIFGTLFFVLGGYFGYRYLLPATCSFFVETATTERWQATALQSGFAALNSCPHVRPQGPRQRSERASEEAIPRREVLARLRVAVPAAHRHDPRGAVD
jgi:Sec-independent protein secretion pathway component TatC